MPVIHDLKDLKKPLVNPVLTIGNFDGVHKGHLALFGRVKELAGQIRGQTAVMTFDPHPLKVMKPGGEPALITPIQQKIQLMQKAGMDVILCIPFTKEFASLSAQDFVRRILLEKIRVRELVVGYDYSFGRNREGNLDLLKKMASSLGFGLHIVGPVYVNHTLVSSTSVRRLIREGELTAARELLGRDYQICGTVVKGKNRGARLLGFPTANLEPVDELIPKGGVYAVKVGLEDEIHEGVTNIGWNPTFRNGEFSIETHILDFHRDLMGMTLRVDFIERLREEKTFSSVDELKEQISRDIERAREVLARAAGKR